MMNAFSVNRLKLRQVVFAWLSLLLTPCYSQENTQHCAQAIARAQPNNFDKFPEFLDSTSAWERVHEEFVSHTYPKVNDESSDTKKHRASEDDHIRLLRSWNLHPDQWVKGRPPGDALVKKVFQDFYLAMKAAHAAGLISTEELAFPAISVRGEPVWFRPGIDPWRKNLQVQPRGLIPHREWMSLRAQGIIPIDSVQLDHDLAHLSTYLRFPKYFAGLQRLYRRQFILASAESDENWKSYHRISDFIHQVDELGVRIDSDKQVEAFKKTLPNEIGWESNGENIRTLSDLELNSWALKLITERDLYLSRHGAVTLQIYFSPNTPIVHRTLERFVMTATREAAFRLDANGLSSILDQLEIIITKTASLSSTRHNSYRRSVIVFILEIIFQAYKVMAENQISPLTQMKDLDIDGRLMPGSGSEKFMRALRVSGSEN